MHYYISQIQAYFPPPWLSCTTISVKSKHTSPPPPPGPTPRLLTIFENMRQFPGGGHKKREISLQQGKKSVANPPPCGQLDCLAKKSRLSNYLKIKRIHSSREYFSREFPLLIYQVLCIIL